jgi:hypothetical protein
MQYSSHCSCISSIQYFRYEVVCKLRPIHIRTVLVWSGLAGSFSKNVPRGFMLEGSNISGSVPKLRDEKQVRCWYWVSVTRRLRIVKALNVTGARHKANSVTAVVRKVTCIHGIGGTDKATQNKAMCRRKYNENSYCLQRALIFAYKFVSYDY